MQVPACFWTILYATEQKGVGAEGRQKIIILYFAFFHVLIHFEHFYLSVKINFFHGKICQNIPFFRCVGISINAKFTNSQTHKLTDSQTHRHLAFYAFITVYEYVWLCMTMYAYVWLCVTMFDYVWLCMTMYDYV